MRIRELITKTFSSTEQFFDFDYFLFQMKTSFYPCSQNSSNEKKTLNNQVVEMTEIIFFFIIFRFHSELTKKTKNVFPRKLFISLSCPLLFGFLPIINVWEAVD